MGHSEFEVRIDRSPEDVWTYLADWRHDLGWQEGWIEVSVERPGSVRAGTRKTKMRRTPLGLQGVTVEATRVDDIDHEWEDVVVKGIATGTTGHTRVLADAMGSRVRISVDTPRRGLARWLAPLIERSSGLVLAQGLERLKRILETDAVEGAGGSVHHGEGSMA